ncbi:MULTISPECIES: hypothetical protein [Robinsoniella]|nr:hypothetical protein [Robinsoniella sp. KNHs210]
MKKWYEQMQNLINFVSAHFIVVRNDVTIKVKIICTRLYTT